MHYRGCRATPQKAPIRCRQCGRSKNTLCERYHAEITRQSRGRLPGRSRGGGRCDRAARPCKRPVRACKGLQKPGLLPGFGLSRSAGDPRAVCEPMQASMIHTASGARSKQLIVQVCRWGTRRSRIPELSPDLYAPAPRARGLSQPQDSSRPRFLAPSCNLLSADENSASPKGSRNSRVCLRLCLRLTSRRRMAT